MTGIISRRDLLQISYGTAAAIGISTVAAELHPVNALAQSGSRNPVSPISNVPKEEKTVSTGSANSGAQLFYRDDWFGEPWLKPEPVLMIHGVGESSLTWFGWVPRMAGEFRLLRPDLPGLGRSAIRGHGRDGRTRAHHRRTGEALPEPFRDRWTSAGRGRVPGLHVLVCGQPRADAAAR